MARRKDLREVLGMNPYVVRGLRAFSLICVIIGVAGYSSLWVAVGNMFFYVFWSVLDGA